ncbi:putative mitochondrial protein AtMg00860 [Bidens hawaiensis]|uniref:putative mitochondrial protein AtMg00860 n=1 Tax=Bidens hawaiensis TaxID=980011 RepID=UPI0040494EDD
MGVASYSTMKVTGSIGIKPLHILIDSISTNNFLDERIASKMSSSIEQHLSDLEAVLNVFMQNSLLAKKEKCTFAGSRVEYLGHVITKEDVSSNPSKIEAVVNRLVPTTLKQLRGFLGLAGYYRRFINDFGGIAGPKTIF